VQLLSRTPAVLCSRSRDRAGFTLVGLVAVVVVLAILAGIILPGATNGVGEAQDVRRMEDMQSLRAALEQYHADHGAYPTTYSTWRGDAPDYGGKGYGENGYIPGLVPHYLPVLPRDPDERFPSGSKGYLYRSNGSDYKLLAYYTPSAYPDDGQLHDPKRPTWAWQVSSPGGHNW